MKRKIAIASAFALLLVLAGVPEFHGQGMPPGPVTAVPPAFGVMGRAVVVPPYPPVTMSMSGNMEDMEMVEPPEPPDPPNFMMGEGGSLLGVALADVTPDEAKELKLPAEAGAIIKEVKENSPASKAGLVKNDVILEFAGERVRSVAQLRRLVRETPPGRTVALQISRGGQARTLSAKIEASKNQFYFNQPVIPPQVELPAFGYFNFTPHGPSLGISGDELTTQLANYFGVKQGKGILVREVVVGSAAEKAGLKAGDVIVQVEGKPVSSVSELRRELVSGSPEESRKLKLTIVRDRREQTLPVELEKLAPLEHRKLAEAAVREAKEGLQMYQNNLQREAEIINAKALRAQAEEIRRQMLSQQLEVRQTERELKRQLEKQVREAMEMEELKREVTIGEGVI